MTDLERYADGEHPQAGDFVMMKAERRVGFSGRYPVANEGIYVQRLTAKQGHLATGEKFRLDTCEIIGRRGQYVYPSSPHNEAVAERWYRELHAAERRRRMELRLLGLTWTDVQALSVNQLEAACAALEARP